MNPENCPFSNAKYRVSKTTLRLLLQKFPEHAVDFVLLSDDKVNIRSSATSLPNTCCVVGHVLIVVMVPIAVSKLGCTELFIEPRESGRRILR